MCSLTTHVFRRWSNFRNSYCKLHLQPVHGDHYSVHSGTVQCEVLILFKFCKEHATGEYTVSKSIGRCVHIVCLHLKIMHVWILSMSTLTASNCNSNHLGRPLSELESFGAILRSVAAWSRFLLPSHGSQSLVWDIPVLLDSAFNCLLLIKWDLKKKKLQVLRIGIFLLSSGLLIFIFCFYFLLTTFWVITAVCFCCHTLTHSCLRILSQLQL